MIPRELTCIELKTGKIAYTALVDGGSNCSIISRSVINRLLLTDQIIPTRQPVRSFTGELSHFEGHITIGFRIGNNYFKHKFQIQPDLNTGTDALLGVDFLNQAEVSVHYGHHGQEMIIRSKVIPIVEQQKRIYRNNNILVTYTARKVKENSKPENKIAKSCEYRRVDPYTSVVIRVTLPGSNWPEQVTVEQSELNKGWLVEAQLVTTRRHEPNSKAKCKAGCLKTQCVADCPTVHFWV